jgi:hypothetical protein
MRSIPCLAVAIALLLTGCHKANSVDLAAIQKMVQATDTAAPTYALISADLYASCQRTREWQLAGTWTPVTANSGSDLTLPTLPPPALAALSPADRKRYAAAAKAYAAEQTSFRAQVLAYEKIAGAQSKTKAKATSAAAVPSPQDSMAPSQVASPPSFGTDDQCATQAIASADWQTRNLLLTNYVDALGKLAGAGQTTTAGASPAPAATASTSASAPSTSASTKMTAIQSAVASISNVYFANEDRAAIAAQIGDQKAVLGNIDAIIDSLERFADQDYRQILSIERGDINLFYQANLMPAKSGAQTLQTLSYRKQWMLDLAALDQKLTAINAYRSSLETIRSAGTAIEAQSDKRAPLAATADAYVSAVVPDIAAIQKAFGGTPTPSPSPSSP